MFLLLSSTAIVVGLSSMVVTVLGFKNAPVAFEDDTGFHRDPPE